MPIAKCYGWLHHKVINAHVPGQGSRRLGILLIRPSSSESCLLFSVPLVISPSLLATPVSFAPFPRVASNFRNFRTWYYCQSVVAGRLNHPPKARADLARIPSPRHGDSNDARVNRLRVNTETEKLTRARVSFPSSSATASSHIRGSRSRLRHRTLGEWQHPILAPTALSLP